MLTLRATAGIGWSCPAARSGSSPGPSQARIPAGRSGRAAPVGPHPRHASAAIRSASIRVEGAVRRAAHPDLQGPPAVRGTDLERRRSVGGLSRKRRDGVRVECRGRMGAAARPPLPRQSFTSHSRAQRGRGLSADRPEFQQRRNSRSLHDPEDSIGLSLAPRELPRRRRARRFRLRLLVVFPLSCGRQPRPSRGTLRTR